MHIGQSTAIITDAGHPIGRAIALYLSSLGATLALIDNNEDELKHTLIACKKNNPQCSAFYLHNYDEASIQSIFEQVIDRFGSINILLNTWTGSEIPHLLSPTSISDFNNIMHQSATSFFTFGKVAAEYMRQQQHSAVIINLALSYEKDHPYTATTSKTIVSGLTHSWAQELEMFDIRVGGIIPINSKHEDNDNSLISISMQDELVRSIEYIVRNDSFNGRMIESEINV